MAKTFFDRGGARLALSERKTYWMLTKKFEHVWIRRRIFEAFKEETRIFGGMD